MFKQLRGLIGVIGGVYCLFVSTPTNATPQKIECVTTHFPPYAIYDDASQTFSGMDVDIVNHLASTLNWQLKIRYLPWARIKKGIDNQEFECVFSLAKTPLREQQLTFTQLPMHTTEYAVFTKAPWQVKHLQELNGKLLGVKRGITPAREVQDKIDAGDVHAIYANDDEALFTMLEKGRIDAIVTNRLVGRYVAKQLGVKRLKSYTLETVWLPTFLAFKPGVVKIKEINNAMLALMYSPHYQTILDSYE